MELGVMLNDRFTVAMVEFLDARVPPRPEGAGAGEWRAPRASFGDLARSLTAHAALDANIQVVSHLSRPFAAVPLAEFFMPAAAAALGPWAGALDGGDVPRVVAAAAAAAVSAGSAAVAASAPTGGCEPVLASGGLDRSAFADDPPPPREAGVRAAVVVLVALLAAAAVYCESRFAARSSTRSID